MPTGYKSYKTRKGKAGGVVMSPPSPDKTLSIIKIVMTMIVVIAALIGTTELFFELLDHHERKQHD